jgi:sarcosine oxidase subunit beta
MPLGLLKYGFSSKYPAKHHFTPAKDLKKHYDVVIIGGGGHGCAIAYNLAKYHGN